MLPLSVLLPEAPRLYDEDEAEDTLYSLSNHNEGDHDFAVDDDDDDQSSHSIDFDLSVERLQFRLKTWKRTIRRDSHCLWIQGNGEALWEYFDQDVFELRDAWIDFLIAWVQRHLEHGTDEKSLELHYELYCRRFVKIVERAQECKAEQEQQQQQQQAEEQGDVDGELDDSQPEEPEQDGPKGLEPPTLAATLATKKLPLSPHPRRMVVRDGDEDDLGVPLTPKRTVARMA